MKKSLYLALAAVTLTLFACNSKPAESAQQAEEQMEQVAPEVFPAEAEEAPVAEADESLAEGSSEAEAVEELPAEEPAAEPAATEEPAEEEIYAMPDNFAVPSCSEQELLQLLAKKLNDVDPEADDCIVVVKMVVEKDGSISNPVVVRGSKSEKVNEYAVKRVLEKMPKFKEPGKKNGRPVRSYFSVRVVFKNVK